MKLSKKLKNSIDESIGINDSNNMLKAIDNSSSGNILIWLAIYFEENEFYVKRESNKLGKLYLEARDILLNLGLKINKEINKIS